MGVGIEGTADFGREEDVLRREQDRPVSAAQLNVIVEIQDLYARCSASALGPNARQPGSTRE